MISQAIALAIITFSGFIFIFLKLPKKIQNFIKERTLITDIICLTGAYTLLGGTLTALFSSALVGLFVSAVLHIANNKEDFSYLFDLVDFIKEKAAQVQKILKEYGQNYNASKQES